MEDKKPKTHKGKLYLESLLPKLIEDPKQCLFINTANSSEIMRMILNDLYLLRKDYSKKLNKKEKIENLTNGRDSIEFLCEKNNCSLFTFTSDIKKRPMDITFGFTFNHSILDAFNFEVTNYIPIEYFNNKKINIDSYMKPILFFQGELFESEFEYERVKKFFIDYFRLYDVETAIISELKRIIVISIDNNDKIIKIRNYQIEGEIKENNLNNLNFIEIGPSLDLKVRKKWQNESNNLDYTCIQILEKDNIKNFLEIDKNILNGNYFSLKKNLLIQIYDFQLKLSVGNIEPKTYKNDKEENYIYYSCNIQAGWSGGPILTCDNLLIGVHNAGCSKTNKGINIKCIINDIIKKIEKDKNKES